MRNDELNMDAMLRDTAQQQNAALPLDDWKNELLKKCQEGVPTQMPEPVDELAERRSRMQRMRRVTIGFASAAAMLLLLLSAKDMIARSNMSEAAPREDSYSMQKSAGEDTAMPEQAGILAAPAPAAMPADTEAPAEAAPQAPQMSIAGGQDNTADAADQSMPDNGAGSEGAPRLALDDPAASAIEAVREELRKAGLTQEAEGVFAQAELVQNQSYDLIMVGSNIPASVVSIELYVVRLGVDEQSAKSYAVDSQAFVVYGEIVRK